MPMTVPYKLQIFMPMEVRQVLRHELAIFHQRVLEHRVGEGGAGVRRPDREDPVHEVPSGDHLAAIRGGGPMCDEHPQVVLLDCTYEKGVRGHRSRLDGGGRRAAGKSEQCSSDLAC